MMSISSTYNSIAANMQASLQKYQNSADALASMNIDDPADVAVLAAINSEMASAENQVLAAAEVSKVQDEVVGQLINTFA